MNSIDTLWRKDELEQKTVQIASIEILSAIMKN